MTTTVANFDVRTATAVVQMYDGASDGLQAFIDACSLLKDLTEEPHQAMLLKFLKTRITGKARLGLPANINTFNQFITHITEKCQDLTSPEQIIAKLKSIKQKDNLDSFCEQIEKISDRLKSTYIQQKIPEEVAKKMVTKAAVDALINGVSNSETKLILKVGSFDSVQNAVQKVQENGSGSQHSAILTFSARGHLHQNGYRSSGFRKHNHSNFRHNNKNYNSNQNFQSRNNGHNGNFRNYFQRNTSYSNSNGRGRFNNNINRNFPSRMFPMEAAQVETQAFTNQMVPMRNDNMNTNHSPLGFNQQNFSFLGQPTAFHQRPAQNQNQSSR
ncbi:putative mediator of RNA polymerase II transcription subunit 26 [Toxorhynchites rutilus septentrionalis]|uniref:putative mediator of RNA polymerase II transcription subunit 26 n=1 Tax=Toxorhynchites rutilus septentrionalis TaxID=329112 RepID=UPI002478EA95|nr:putative mediator of RNA polymerase II transcription subunit 26 [Toxorhynchites rutilus septentrionalis]